MKVAELSEQSGVPIPTIKYYLREGLLMRGALTAPNQADYGAAHLERLSLVRTLVEVAEMDLAQVRKVVDALADPDISQHEAIGSAFYSLPTGRHPDDDGDVRKATSEAAGWIDDLGLMVNSEAPALRMLGEALATLRRFGWQVEPADLETYLKSMREFTATEVDRRPAASLSRVVEHAVVGTVAFEKILVALRRLLLEDRSARIPSADL